MLTNNLCTPFQANIAAGLFELHECLFHLSSNLSRLHLNIQYVALNTMTHLG